METARVTFPGLTLSVRGEAQTDELVKDFAVWVVENVYMMAEQWADEAGLDAEDVKIKVSEE